RKPSKGLRFESGHRMGPPKKPTANETPPTASVQTSTRRSTCSIAHLHRVGCRSGGSLAAVRRVAVRGGDEMEPTVPRRSPSGRGLLQLAGLAAREGDPV